MIFRRFPYTTLNDINLDWIIKQVKQIAAALQGKQDKPDSAGVAGQVLGLDENLDPVWLDQTGGGGGTTNYNNLTNKPQINSVTLSGNKTAAELGLATPADIPAVPVQSVNGETGAVELDAADVGALPDNTYIPTGSLQLPVMDGEANAGTTVARFACEGHVHPENTNKVSVDELAVVIDGNVAQGSAIRGRFAVVKNSTIQGITDGIYQLAKPISANTVVDSTYFSPYATSPVNNIVNSFVRTATENEVIDAWVDAAPQFDQFFRFAVRTPTTNYLIMFTDLGLELYNLNTNTRERVINWDVINV